MTVNTDNWYCIKFDVPKDKNISAIEFAKKMQAFLQEIENFNHSIFPKVDETYTVVSYIEDFEAGSVKWWLLDKLQKIDDSAIDKFCEKPISTIVASILKFAKQTAIEVILSKGSHDVKIVDIIKPIKEKLDKEKQLLQSDNMFPEPRLDEKELLKSVSNMSKLSEDLSGSVSLLPDYTKQDIEIQIAQDFTYDSTEGETQESGNNLQEVECEVRIKKPDLDGNSKWDVYYIKKISVAMMDKEFSDKIKKGLKICCKTKLRVKLQIIYKTDAKNDIIEGAETYNITKVLDVIEPVENGVLFK